MNTTVVNEYNLRASDKKLAKAHLQHLGQDIQDARVKFFGGIEEYANVKATQAFVRMTKGESRLTNIAKKPFSTIRNHIRDEITFFLFLPVKIWSAFLKDLRTAFLNYGKFVLNVAKQIIAFPLDIPKIPQKLLWIKENMSLLTRAAFMISAAIHFSLPTCPSGQTVQLVGEHAINLDDYIEEAYDKRDDIAGKVEEKWGEAKGTVEEIRNGAHGPAQLLKDVQFTAGYLAEQALEESEDIAERVVGVQNSEHWEHNLLGKGPGIADKMRRVAIAANFALASLDTLREATLREKDAKELKADQQKVFADFNSILNNHKNCPEDKCETPNDQQQKLSLLQPQPIAA